MNAASRHAAHVATRSVATRFRTLGAVAIVAAAAMTLSACATGATATPTVPHGTASNGAASNLTGELTIFAAASLTASFTELSEAFVAANPGVTVKPISFDGSSTLATQINEGAPVDVFASADEANMAKVADIIDGTGTIFVTNVLQIAVQPGNPKKITGLADLAKAGVTTVLCAPAVPCGTASHKILDLDGVTVTPVSEEQNVKAVLTKVRLGEVDAGLVYKTDVTSSAGAVDGVDIAGADRAINSYPIAALKESKNAAVAKAFVEFVLSPAGQKILAKYGFGAP
ncbi:MAG: molybdate ABC transporter substrate-binding protein [Terrimesophilobacter sp.]